MRNLKLFELFSLYRHVDKMYFLPPGFKIFKFYFSVFRNLTMTFLALDFSRFILCLISLPFESVESYVFSHKFGKFLSLSLSEPLPLFPPSPDIHWHGCRISEILLISFQSIFFYTLYRLSDFCYSVLHPTMESIYCILNFGFIFQFSDSHFGTLLSSVPLLRL